MRTSATEPLCVLMPEGAVWMMSIGCWLAATSVQDWYVDPHLPERQFGWVTEAADAYVRPVKRIAVRCRQQDGEFAYGVLLSAMSAQHVLGLTSQPLCLLDVPAAVLLAYVTFYD